MHPPQLPVEMARALTSPAPAHARAAWAAEELSRDPSAKNTTGEAVEAAQALEAIRSCSVIVGLHPDGATEPLVDLAIALSKP